MRQSHPCPSAWAGPPSDAPSRGTENSTGPSSPPLLSSAQSVFAEKEYLFGTAVPAAISSPWKSPRAARCKSPAEGTPAFFLSPFPLPRWRDGAFRTRRAPIPPSPVAPAGTRSRRRPSSGQTRPSCIFQGIRLAQIPRSWRVSTSSRPSLFLRFHQPHYSDHILRLRRHPRVRAPSRKPVSSFPSNRFPSLSPVLPGCLPLLSLKKSAGAITIAHPSRWPERALDALTMSRKVVYFHRI